MKTRKINIKKLVDYIYSNLVGVSNEKITVYKNENGSFSHTRDNEWLGGCTIKIVSIGFGDETPKSKAELKRIVEYKLSITE
jgi:hypothetical protein